MQHQLLRAIIRIVALRQRDKLTEMVTSQLKAHEDILHRVQLVNFLLLVNLEPKGNEFAVVAEF